jgi:ribosomal protein S8
MLQLSHLENIKNKLSYISSLDELEKEERQLYSLIEKHYTLYVGIDISQDEFAINVKNASCETIYKDGFDNHHSGFCKLLETFNSLNEQKEFRFAVAIESTGPYHKALVRFLQESGISVFLYNAQTAKHRLAAARAKGKIIGRPKGVLGKSKLDGKKDEIQLFLNKGVSKSAIAKIMDVSRTTLRHFITTRKLN